ncbi:hypothetical protein BH20GEM2_BH20GEM2_21030 [soil metagenome]
MIGTGRLEAFSDGVIAIIITIMVLEMKVPEGITLTALRPLLPVFLSYVLSFVYLGIYWNNHHHFLHVTQRVSGGVLWANLHLLFWLSLIPFVTGWMGENSFAEIPTAVYGGVLLMAAIVPDPAAGDPRGGRSRLAAGGGGEPRRQREPLAAALRRRDNWRSHSAVDRGCAVRRGRAVVAGPRPSHRASRGGERRRREDE